MEIINYQEQHPNERGILGKFDVRIDEDLTFPNIQVVQGKNGGIWIKRAAYLKHEDALGNKTWGHYPEFSKAKEKVFNTQVAELVKPYLTENSISSKW
jgi:hypothetical protein